MGQPTEIYQVNQIAEVSLESMQQLINELNLCLFEISKRLSRLSIPQDTSSVTTVAHVVTLLENAGIGAEEA